MKNSTGIPTRTSRPTRTGSIRAPKAVVEGVSVAARQLAVPRVQKDVQPVDQPVKPVDQSVGVVVEFLQLKGNREDGVDTVRKLATSVAARFANATGVKSVELVEQDVQAKVWTVSELLDNPELSADLFPRSNFKAFMNAVRRTMGADGMLPTTEEADAEELKVRFIDANEQLVNDLEVVYNSWYSTSGKLLPAEMRGKLITATTTLSMPWVGSWVVGGSVMQRVQNQDALRMTDFVPAPSMLAWTETLRGLTPEQVEAIKATKGETNDLGAVAEAIASVIAAAQDHLVTTRFGVVEVSNLERVVAVALKDGGHGIQIIRQARVKDGVINVGSHLNLTGMSRVMSFYELRFADDVIEVSTDTLDTVL